MRAPLLSRSHRRRRRLQFPITVFFDGDGGKYFTGGWSESGGNVLNDKIVLGSDVVVNGNMETGDPPSSWAALDSTLDGVADPHSGLQALQVTATAAAGKAQQAAVPTALGTWYQLNTWSKTTAGDLAQIIVREGSGFAEVFNSGGRPATSYENLSAVFRAPHTDHLIQLISVSDTDICFFDDIVMKPNVLTSLINNLKSQFGLSDGFFIDVYINAVTAKFQVGAIWNYDGSNNFGMAYMDGTSLIVDKSVAGTYTQLASVAQAVTTDQVLRIENPAGSNALSIKYNGVEKATPTIADASVIGNTGIALFSTEANNAISKVVIGKL